MKVTAVIPTYNSMKYVDQCLDSVLDQKYLNLEVVVYDNESTDGTYEHLLDRQDGRFEVRSVPNVEPNGYREAMNHIFENCTSDYITFISSDDYIHAEYISNAVQVIESIPQEVKCLQSGMVWVDEKGIEINYHGHMYDSLDEFKEMALKLCPVTNPTVFYHKSIWSILSECREAHFENNLVDIGVGDYDMWCGLANRGVYVHPVNGSLGYYYRWHPEQATWKVQESNVNYDEIIRSFWRDKWIKN
jgi:glycosyltransferase involved in cell wall biosynthesis|tara:strand:- start:17502 stop:18239 length:738 start_codon:yes stop_codon:yes gene_type:complete